MGRRDVAGPEPLVLVVDDEIELGDSALGGLAVTARLPVAAEAASALDAQPISSTSPAPARS